MKKTCRCGSEETFKVCTMYGADWMCADCYNTICEAGK